MRLIDKQCTSCKGDVSPMKNEEVNRLLGQLNGWRLNDDATEISRNFKFKNFRATMTFVNKVADIANQENHHPDLEIGYNYCLVRYSTHAVKGLSENDFICAAKVDQLHLEKLI